MVNGVIRNGFRVKIVYAVSEAVNIITAIGKRFGFVDEGLGLNGKDTEGQITIKLRGKLGVVLIPLFLIALEKFDMLGVANRDGNVLFAAIKITASVNINGEAGLAEFGDERKKPGEKVVVIDDKADGTASGSGVHIFWATVVLVEMSGFKGEGRW